MTRVTLSAAAMLLFTGCISQYVFVNRSYTPRSFNGRSLFVSPVRSDAVRVHNAGDVFEDFEDYLPDSARSPRTASSIIAEHLCTMLRRRLSDVPMAGVRVVGTSAKPDAFADAGIEFTRRRVRMNDGGDSITVALAVPRRSLLERIGVNADYVLSVSRLIVSRDTESMTWWSADVPEAPVEAVVAGPLWSAAPFGGKVAFTPPTPPMIHHPRMHHTSTQFLTSIVDYIVWDYAATTAVCSGRLTVRTRVPKVIVVDVLTRRTWDAHFGELCDEITARLPFVAAP